jgi:hypothetical protein
LWIFLSLSLAVFTGCDSETDDQLLAKVNPAIGAGHFRKQSEAVDAISRLLSRGHPGARTPQVVDCLLTTGAVLLTDDAEWTDRSGARSVYDLLKRYDDGVVVDGLVRKVISDAQTRLHVLFLGVKLGIHGSEERLNTVLDQHGDKQMAEDFLNSGSTKLYEGGKSWAASHGYYISEGMGSHRVSWGDF